MKYSIPTTQTANNWILAFASVLGKGHIDNHLPCQDACDVRLLEDNWGIAVVADGAGSAYFSDIGAQKTVDFAIEIFSDLISEQGWITNNALPNSEAWQQLSFQALQQTYQKLQEYSHLQNQKGFNISFSLSDLACTLIVVIFHSSGLLTTHIGDGRAAYCDRDGNWKNMMTPFSGELANETIFITSPFWELENAADFVESRVIEVIPLAFCLLSDGMEKACFEVNLYNELQQKYYDPNLPFPKFLIPCQKALLKLQQEGKTQAEINRVWADFLKGGNRVLQTETDDKTLVMGVFI